LMLTLAVFTIVHRRPVNQDKFVDLIGGVAEASLGLNDRILKEAFE